MSSKREQCSKKRTRIGIFSLMENAEVEKERQTAALPTWELSLLYKSERWTRDRQQPAARSPTLGCGSVIRDVTTSVVLPKQAYLSSYPGVRRGFS